jgi:hypothetical protein
MSRRRKAPIGVPVPPATKVFFEKLWPDGPPTAADVKHTREEEARARKSVQHTLAVDGGYVQPPWMDNDPKNSDGPRVRVAKAYLRKCYPQGEWRKMKLNAVHREIFNALKDQGEQTVSPDTVARAMGRRKQRKRR